MDRELPTTREEADDPATSTFDADTSHLESYFGGTGRESHGFGNVHTANVAAGPSLCDDPDDGPPPLELDPDSSLAANAAAPASSGTGLLGMMDDDDEFPALGAQPAKPVKRKRATGLGNLGNTCFVSFYILPKSTLVPSSGLFF